MQHRFFLHSLVLALAGFVFACGEEESAANPDTDDVVEADDTDEAGEADDTDGDGPRPLDAGRRPTDAGKPTANDAAVAFDGSKPASTDAAVGSLDAGVGTAQPPVIPPSSGGIVRGPAPTSESASKAGPYQVKSYTSGFRDGPAYADATIWYPVDAEAPYGFVAVVPGFVSVQAQIANWGPFLASHGIAAITIGTNTPTDNPPQRADALIDALKSLAEEHTRADSPLKGKLDLSRQGTMGWSMGGGGSLLVAERTPALKAAISLCGWNPAYSYSKVKVPSLLFAIVTDGLAAGQSTGFYDTIPQSTPKLYWEADNVTPFFAGHDTFNDPASLNGAAGRYGLSFLKVFLEGDERYRQFLKQDPPNKVQFKNNL